MATTDRKFMMTTAPIPIPAITARVELFTPDLADLYCTSMEYRGQRALRTRHVQRLADAMLHGTFTQGTEIRIICYRNQQYLIDGQHRLHAVVASGVAQLFTVVESEAASEQELAWAYGTTDIGMRRTAGDLYTALDLPTEMDLGKREVDRLSAAVTFLAEGCIRGKRDIRRDEIVHLISLYGPYMRQYCNIIQGCEVMIKYPAYRAATVAIALLSLRFSLPRAIDRDDPDVLGFWKGVIFDDAIGKNDARKTANRHLRTTTMTSSSVRAAGVVHVTPAYSARCLVSCFNAYMAGRELRRPTISDESSRLNMYGVPTDPEKWVI